MKPGKMLYTKQLELRWLLNDLIAEAPSMRLDMANRKQPGLGCWSRPAPGSAVELGGRAVPGQCWQPWGGIKVASWPTASVTPARVGKMHVLGRSTCILSQLPRCCNSRRFTCTAPSLQTSSTPLSTALDKEFCKKNIFSYCQSWLSASEDKENRSSRHLLLYHSGFPGQGEEGSICTANTAQMPLGTWTRSSQSIRVQLH